MKNLCRKDRALWKLVVLLLDGAAVDYDIAYRWARPTRRKDTEFCAGTCSKRGVIRITLRVFRKGRWAKRPNRAYEIVDTMAHELAHAVHWNHGPQWFSLYSRLLNFFAVNGTYQKVRKYAR